MTVSFDKRLAELDAYLQMLIERSELLDNKLASTSTGAERNGLLLIKSRLETLLGSIKHSIVLLQIAKVSIKTLPDSDTSSTGSASKRPYYSSNNNSSSRATNQSSSTNQEEYEDEEDSDGAILANTTAAITASLKEQMDLKRQASSKGKNVADSKQTAMPAAPKTSVVATAAIDLPTSAQEDEDDTFYDAADEQQLNWDALYEEEEEDLGSLENQGSVIKHLMSQIRIGMDLTKVVLPTFILERRSLLEMYADFFAHPDLFSSIPDYETPEERMIQIVRWYLSAFHAGRKSAVAKKPYNPILGEIFLCHWNLQDLNDKEQQQQDELLSADNLKQQHHHNQVERFNSTESTCSVSDIEKFSNQLHRNSLMFVAEQVSHHPPVSAFYAENREKLISCSAHIYTKSKYLGLSVGVHNIGEGTISLLKHKENYVCTFPSAYGRSILTVPWVELGGSVNISCRETGYSANIEFVTKPFYGGKKHRIVAEILRPNKEPFMAIEGEWNGCMYSKTPPNSNDKKMFVDTTCLPVIKKNVRSISSQESFESRNVWKEVTRALKLHDVSSATAAKTFIEQRQRDLLKDRIEKGIKWKTRYFEELDDGWTYAKPLAARLSSADSSNSNAEQKN